MGAGMTVKSRGQYEVDASPENLTDIDIEANRAAFRDATGGKHGWVMGIVHEVADPEAALGEFEATAESLVGIIKPRCLFCNVKYTADLRESPCDALMLADELAAPTSDERVNPYPAL